MQRRCLGLRCALFRRLLQVVFHLDFQQRKNLRFRQGIRRSSADLGKLLGCRQPLRS